MPILSDGPLTVCFDNHRIPVDCKSSSTATCYDNKGKLAACHPPSHFLGAAAHCYQTAANGSPTVNCDGPEARGYCTDVNGNAVVCPPQHISAKGIHDPIPKFCYDENGMEEDCGFFTQGMACFNQDHYPVKCISGAGVDANEIQALELNPKYWILVGLGGLPIGYLCRKNNNYWLLGIYASAAIIGPFIIARVLTWIGEGVTPLRVLSFGTMISLGLGYAGFKLGLSQEADAIVVLVGLGVTLIISFWEWFKGTAIGGELNTLVTDVVSWASTGNNSQVGLGVISPVYGISEGIGALMKL